MNQQHFNKHLQQIISAIVLGSVLSLGTGLTLLQGATAAPSILSQVVASDRAANLPNSVADAVLQAASQQLGLPISQLRIVEAEQQTWSDGCLGLAGSDEFCTQALVPGYKVTVEGNQKRLVYRTDESGRNIRLDRAASQIDNADTIKPVPIPQSELPSPLQPGVIFRAINSGGIAGLTTKINLLRDGRILQVQDNRGGTTSQTQISRVSQRQMRQFLRVLKQQFSQFKGLEYPPSSSAADLITITLTSRAGTTRYTDINQENLPKHLQAVIQAWNQLLQQE